MNSLRFRRPPGATVNEASRCALAALSFAFAGCDRPTSAPPTSPTVVWGASAEPSAAEDAQLAAAAAGLLAGEFQRAGVTARVEGGVVHLAEHALRLRVTPRQLLAPGPGVAASVAVTVALDDRDVPGFRGVHMAVSATQREALDGALREWATAAGAPMVSALRARGYTAAQRDAGAIETGLTLGAYAVFPGPASVRGTVPARWQAGLPALHHALISRAEPQLDRLVPVARRREFHSLTVSVLVRNGAAQRGECRIDAVPVLPLYAAIRDLEWPAGEGNYMFTQHYILAGSPPEDAGAAPSPVAQPEADGGR